jgi:hypothetical protein
VTKKNYPLRDVNGVPIGSTEDDETNRLLTEVTPDPDGIFRVLGADGRHNADVVALLQSILYELRELNVHARSATDLTPKHSDFQEVANK